MLKYSIVHFSHCLVSHRHLDSLISFWKVNFLSGSGARGGGGGAGLPVAHVELSSFSWVVKGAFMPVHLWRTDLYGMLHNFTQTWHFAFLLKEKHFPKFLNLQTRSLHHSYVNKPLFVQAVTKSRRTSPIKNSSAKEEYLINNVGFILINITKESLERKVLTLKDFSWFNATWESIGWV